MADRVLREAERLLPSLPDSRLIKLLEKVEAVLEGRAFKRAIWLYDCDFLQTCIFRKTDSNPRLSLCGDYWQGAYGPLQTKTIEGASLCHVCNEIRDIEEQKLKWCELTEMTITIKGQTYKAKPWRGPVRDAYGNGGAPCNCQKLLRVFDRSCVCYGRAYCPEHSKNGRISCVGGHD